MRNISNKSSVTEHLMVLFEKTDSPAPTPPKNAPTSGRRASGRDAKIQGRPGSGRVSGSVAGLASTDPSTLLSKLNITQERVTGENDIEKVMSILNAALENGVMSEAFSSVESFKGRDMLRVARKTEEISDRDASLYIRSILSAAEQSLNLGLQNSVTVSPSKESVLIQFRSIP